MRDFLTILREHELRLVVLAVVLGYAVASGVGALISLVVNTVAVLVRSVQSGPSFDELFPYVFRSSLITGPLTIVLWAAVAVATLAILNRAVPSNDDLG
jgi:hypothetical protein